jgi:uridine kinase
MMEKVQDELIREVPPRETVQVHLPEGCVLEGPRGTQLETFLTDLDDPEAPIVGAIVNGELRELTYPIEMDSDVRVVTMGEADGMRIYRRSLTFLLAVAFEELFPDAKLYVEHSVSSGGYFCQVSGRDLLNEEELGRIERRMREIVDANLPFAKSQVSTDDAITYFEKKGHLDKAHLMAHRRKAHLVLYQLRGVRDYYHGYMVPSTGYLKWFRLAKISDGFTLCFPRRHCPTHLQQPPEYPVLLSTFRLYGDWLKTLGIESVGALNDAIIAGRSREIILVSEALHEHRIAEIATHIKENQGKINLVLVAGPSSSGKTTFSKRLSVQLIALGLSPFPIEMDDYFVDREKSPIDENGQFDYEALEALDLGRLSHDLQELIAGKEVQLPVYNFKTGRQEVGETVRLRSDHIIILEGIHGLNPTLLPDIPMEQKFRIYASALTQLNLDSNNRVSTTDTRLIRRIVRDAAQRGYNATETIKRWESVRRGEKRYIFPYQENADVMFNSALAYELSVLAPLAEPLLRQVPFRTEEHIEAKRLLTLLEWLLPLDTELIPDNSILREFIGGSILREFVPWQPPMEQGIKRWD